MNPTIFFTCTGVYNHELNVTGSIPTVLAVMLAYLLPRYVNPPPEDDQRDEDGTCKSSAVLSWSERMQLLANSKPCLTYWINPPVAVHVGSYGCCDDGGDVRENIVQMIFRQRGNRVRATKSLAI